MKLGFFIDCFKIDQLGLDILELSKLMDITVFYQSYNRPPENPRFAQFQSNQLWGFDGTVITDSVERAKILIECPSPKRKMLYVWNLEWLYNPGYFNKYSFVYQHDDLELVARSTNHKTIITNCWKEPIAVIEKLNKEDLYEL